MLIKNPFPIAQLRKNQRPHYVYFRDVYLSVGDAILRVGPRGIPESVLEGL